MEKLFEKATGAAQEGYLYSSFPPLYRAQEEGRLDEVEVVNFMEAIVSAASSGETLVEVCGDLTPEVEAAIAPDVRASLCSSEHGLVRLVAGRWLATRSDEDSGEVLARCASGAIMVIPRFEEGGKLITEADIRQVVKANGEVPVLCATRAYNAGPVFHGLPGAVIHERTLSGPRAVAVGYGQSWKALRRFIRLLPPEPRPLPNPGGFPAGSLLQFLACWRLTLVRRVLTMPCVGPELVLVRVDANGLGGEVLAYFSVSAEKFIQGLRTRLSGVNPYGDDAEEVFAQALAESRAEREGHEVMKGRSNP